MQEEKARAPHNVYIQDREKLSLTGATDVENFNEDEVVVYTTVGKLTIKGRELRVERLSVDDGELTVLGNIDSLEYSAGTRQNGGFFSRLFS